MAWRASPRKSPQKSVEPLVARRGKRNIYQVFDQVGARFGSEELGIKLLKSAGISDPGRVTHWVKKGSKPCCETPARQTNNNHVLLSKTFQNNTGD